MDTNQRREKNYIKFPTVKDDPCIFKWMMMAIQLLSHVLIPLNILESVTYCCSNSLETKSLSDSFNL